MDQAETGLCPIVLKNSAQTSAISYAYSYRAGDNMLKLTSTASGEVTSTLVSNIPLAEARAMVAAPYATV